MSQVQAIDFLTRSPNYRILVSEGAQFKPLGNTALVDNYGKSVDQEAAQAKQLGIVDLNAIPRTGFKGREAIDWVRNQGLQIGDQNNQAYRQANGLLVARLADTEVLILNDVNNSENQCESLDEEYHRNLPTRCYSVPRFNSSSWLLITGEFASEMFAKLCGVDLRLHKFSEGSIAQTSIARINGIIIRGDIHGVPAFHFLFDSASTDYMWACLKDAFMEFNGTPVGHSALSEL